MEEFEHMGPAFGLLKPICDSVAVTPTKQNALALKNALGKVPKKALQLLQSYTLFPIKLHLYNKYCLSTEVLRFLVDTLNELLTLTSIQSIDEFMKLYNVLFRQLSCDENNSVLAAVPEELKLSVVNCVQSLFRSAFSDVLDAVYEKKYHPLLSVGVYLCTQIVKLEQMIELRVSALKCLLHISQIHDEADPTDLVFRYKVGNIDMLMMPGMVSTALFAVCGGEVQNHKITLMGLRLWGRLVSLVMDDKCTLKEENEQNENNIYNDCRTQYGSKNFINNNNEDNTTNRRTKKWVLAASNNLESISYKMVEETQNHRNSNVRMELARSIDLILTHCPWNMKSSLCRLVEGLIILCHDWEENVSSFSKEALYKFSQKYSSDTGHMFVEIVQESFYCFLTRVPRLLFKFENHTQMTLLNGYLYIMGSRLPQVLSSDYRLKSLIRFLARLMQMDINEVSLVAGHSLIDIEAGNTLGSIRWKVFTNAPNGKLMEQLEQVCSTLRKYADLSMLVYTLLGLLQPVPDNHRELMLIISTLIASGGPGSMVQHADLVKEVFNVFMDLPIWPASEILSSMVKNVTEEQMRVLQLCLAVEGIGKMAVVVGKDIFNPWLLHCLYALLEAAGNSLDVVASTGLEAIERIANVCAGGSITDLICTNTDYLSHQVTRRLRQLWRHTGLLSVLSVVMRHSSKDVLPSIQEIFSDVLRESSCIYQIDKVYSYLRAFFTFITSVRRWTVEERTAIEETETKTEPTTCNNKTVIEILLDYKKSKDILENLNSDSDEDDDDNRTIGEKISDEYQQFRRQNKDCNLEADKEELDENSEENKKEVPLHVQLIIDILNRCLHFLPFKDNALQILVMQVLEEGILLLESYSDKLLPIIHSIWSPLVNRFNSAYSEPLVIHRAFLLLVTLASTSKDFIRHRTLKSVMPSICKILERTSRESLRKDTNSAYRLTQQYKLQRCLLERLGTLTVDLGLQEKNIYEILNAATPYLSSLQPQPLQNACIGLFKTISEVAKDMVWLHLINVWPPEAVFRHDSCSFLNPIELPVSENFEDSEYKKNVQLLLDGNEF